MILPVKNAPECVAGSSDGSPVRFPCKVEVRIQCYGLSTVAVSAVYRIPKCLQVLTVLIWVTEAGAAVTATDGAAGTIAITIQKVSRSARKRFVLLLFTYFTSYLILIF